MQPTPFVGREKELGEVVSLLRQPEVRLLTLTGAGGSGKTRLAVRAAAEVVDEHEHGVWWVPLQEVREPDRVGLAIGSALGAAGDLAEQVGDRRMLLVLDNFEQVADAAPVLGELLASCPELRLLVTSREVLHLAAEREYPVPPHVEQESVGFFLARARAVRPGFEPDEHVLPICRRVDHLPLVLELAAARVRALSTEQILEQLERSLPLLTGGRRDAPQRQRTLRGAIAWSYELLALEEQAAFRRLGSPAAGRRGRGSGCRRGSRHDRVARGQEPGPLRRRALLALGDDPRVHARAARAERRAGGNSEASLRRLLRARRDRRYLGGGRLWA